MCVRTAHRFTLAGAPGIEPGPSVLETDVLAVEHHAPLRTARLRLRLRLREDQIRDLVRFLALTSTFLISLLYEACVSDKSGSICFAPGGPDRSSCSSWSSNFGVC